MKCQCVVGFHAPLQLRESDTPEPAGSEVLLRVRAAGVCHTDIHLWEGGYDLGGGKTISLADRGLTPPFVMGHETVGTVVAAGLEAGRIDRDRNYLVFPWIGCGRCAACERGQESYCAAPRYLGVQRPGGYADHIIVPHPRYLIDIGDLDPAQAAPYACSGLTTYSALNKIGVERLREAPVVVMGAGGLGLMCVRLIQALGGAGAVVVDIDSKKRDAALAAGATAAIDGAAPDARKQLIAALGGQPAQSVVDTVGAPATVSLAFDALGRGGRLVVVGLFGGATTLSNAMIPIKAVSIIGSYVGDLAELQALMELVRSGRIEPIPIERRPLAQADAALQALRESQVVGRVVLVP